MGESLASLASDVGEVEVEFVGGDQSVGLQVRKKVENVLVSVCTGAIPSAAATLLLQ